MGGNQTTGEFVASRVFDAPRDLVWQCFTDEERMKQWWGPKGFTVLTAKMDLRPGGSFHYGMKAPDGNIMWGKFAYREIKVPERIVFLNMFSDEAGGITRHPFHATWPLQLRTVFTFDALPGGKTEFTLHWSPHETNAEERQTFAAGHESMTQGWGGTLDQLAAYLAQEK
jgi:uncharacterized protein YndB with AHSA1/START domain